MFFPVKYDKIYNIMKQVELNGSCSGGLMDTNEKRQNDPHMDHTVMFKIKSESEISTKEILHQVYRALKEKGYSPINQIVGYLLSGDPAYITSHQNARNMIRRLDRDELLEELVTEYLKDETL